MPKVRVVLADPMQGVRCGLRWLLEGETGIEVVAEAGSVAEALGAPGDVILAGLRFPDGTAADLTSRPRPVLVHTWLPADERLDVDLTRAAVVVRAGRYRGALADGLRAAARPQR